ncbi:MAG: hypothetical protein ACI4GW_08650 [Lachnospiraceae bacterium]
MKSSGTFSEYLKPTECIDFDNPLIKNKSEELKKESKGEVDYIKRAYTF